MGDTDHWDRWGCEAGGSIFAVRDKFVKAGSRVVI